MNKKQLKFYGGAFYNSICNADSIFVLAYPRSGSSWLSRLLSSSLSLPYGSITPFYNSQVIHLHRFFLTSFAKDKTAYIVRDVRDCFISYAGALENELKNGTLKIKDIEDRFGIGVNSISPSSNDFSYFCRSLMNTKIASANWRYHVRKAKAMQLKIIRYEELKLQPETELGNLLFSLGRKPRADLKIVFDSHNIERERSLGLNVRSGGIEKWKSFSERSWVHEVTDWAAPELRLMGYKFDF